MQIQVNVNNLSLIKADELNENEYNIHSIQFNFSSDYEDNLAKVALFTSNDKTYKVIITNNECAIPPEVFANNGCFILGVYAFEVNGDELIERYSPSPINLYIQNGSYIADENTENSEPLTPTDKEQIESLIAQWQQELTQKMQEINTAINETNNLNLDVNKVEKTTTVILTKKDGATKRVQIDDGISLEFMWQGTSLGIKTDNQSEYTFVDLQGVQGPKGETGEPFVIKKTYPSIQAMDADFNNMQLGDYVMIAGDVETEDNAKLFTRGETQWIFISDFSGAQGIQGPTGLTPNIQIGTVTQGTTFNVTRTGSNENPVLNFTLVKGDKGDVGQTGPTGPTGNGIQSITKTGTDGLVDTYTITFTNGSTTTFTVTNGEDGEVTETELDVLRQKVADQQMVINQLPQVSGEGTEITLNNTIEAPMTKFDLEGNSTQETTEGYNLLEPTLKVDNTSILQNHCNVTIEDDVFTFEVTGNDMFLGNVIGTNNNYSKYFGYLMEIPSSGKIYVKCTNSEINKNLVNFYDENKISLGFSQVGSSGVSIPSGAKYCNVRIGRNTSASDVGQIYKTKIMVSTSDVDYEKFTHGASPNPNYEQPIYSAGDNVNVFDKNNVNKLTGVFISQTGELNYSQATRNTLYIACSANTDYMVSREAGKIFRIATYSQVPNSGVIPISNTYNDTATSLTINSGNNASYLAVTYYDSATDTLTEQQILDSIKIEQGTVATPYSPYGMGSITEKIGSKNLYNSKYRTLSNNIYCVNATANENNGIFELTATGADMYMWQVAGAGNEYNGNSHGQLYSFDKDEYTVTISNHTMVANYITFFDKNKVSLGYSSFGGVGYTKTFKKTDSNVPSNAKYFTFRIGYNHATAGQTYSFNVQLEQGSTATTYTTHQEQTYTIPTQQPMRSIGDVRDLFFKNTKNSKYYNKDLGENKWYERHIIKILNLSSVTFKMAQTDDKNAVFCNLANTSICDFKSDALPFLSEYFTWKGIAYGYANALDNGIGLYSYINNGKNYLYFVVPLSIASTVEQFLNWCTDNNIFVQYIADTPQDLPCTEEQISILENMPKSYTEQTNIYSLDVTPAYIEAKGIYDLNKLINS